MHKDTRVFPPTPFQILGCFYCYFGLISVCFAVPAALIHSRFVDMKAASLAWTIFWEKKATSKIKHPLPQSRKTDLSPSRLYVCSTLVTFCLHIKNNIHINRAHNTYLAGVNLLKQSRSISQKSFHLQHL